MGYVRQAIVGVSWITAFRVSTRVVSFLRVLILARLLSPSQFGIFGIATLVLAFLEIITETGINVFFVQKKEPIEPYINDAWLISLIRGIVMCLIIFTLAPTIAGFFNAPGAVGILQLISIVPLIRGFINPSAIKFQKDLQFNKEFFYRFSIFTIDSLTAIFIAVLTREAVSFVWGLIAGAVLEVLLSFIFLKPTPRFTFQLTHLSEIFHSGKWVTLFGVFNYIAQQGDNVAVGKFLGTGPLGVYQMGYNISILPISEVSDVVNRVFFPIYVKIKDDRERLRKAFWRTMKLVTGIVFLFSALLIVLPENFFLLAFGKQWIGIFTIIKILAVYGFFRAIIGTTASLFLALEKQNYIAAMTFVRVSALLIFIIPLTMKWGIVGASITALISVIAELPIASYYLYRIYRSYL